MARLIQDALLWHAPVGFKRSVLYTSIIVVTSLVIARSAWSVDGDILSDGHAILSLDMAITRTYCGGPTAFSHAHRVPASLSANMTLRNVPLRQLVVEKAGSIDAYCRSVDTPFVNSENSLMLVEAMILRLRPNASLAELGQSLHLLKVACIAAFVLLLVALGSSLALALATMLCGLMLLQSMPDYVYSNYPFIFALVLSVVALHGFAIAHRWTDGAVGLVGYGLSAGAWSAFLVNMRTSYLPTVALMFVCVLIGQWRSSSVVPWRARSIRGVALAVCFLAGYVVFQTEFINRQLPAEGRYNAAHPFAHPLVLALGIPASDFSRAMGIRWADEVGPLLAETVDPGVPFLGPRYNTALLRYYTNLWRAHPREMLGVYYEKFSMAGADMIRVLRSSPGVAGWGVNILLTPMALLPSGLCILLLYAAMSLGALGGYLRRGSPAAFVLGLLSLAALLAQIESGVIFSAFVKQYHNYSAFYVLFISLVGIQALGNWAWLSASRSRVPSTS